MTEEFPEQAIAPVDAQQLSPEVEELARKFGVDTTVLETEYGPEAQQVIRDAGLNPLNYAAYRIASRLSFERKREEMRQRGQDPALLYAAIAAAPPDRRHDWVARRFELDPEKLKAFHAALAAEAAENQAATYGEGAQRQKPAPLSFVNPPSASEPVSTSDILPELIETLRAYVVMDDSAALTAALWVMHSHALDAFANTPRLVIRSCEPSGGKTTLLTLLSLLTPRPLDFCGGAGSAVLWALGYRPTLLIDDAASVTPGSRQLQSILRNGAQRTGAKLLGSAKNGAEAVNIFIPAALAVEGKCPPLLTGRCIEIRLRRLTAGQRVMPLHSGSAPPIAELLRKIARWNADVAQLLTAVETDHAVHPMWRPLLAIAQLAGPEWQARARQAMKQIVFGATPSLLQTLLSDIREILNLRQAGEVILPARDGKHFLADRDRLPSAQLARLLGEMEGRPWCERGRDSQPFTPHALARLLAEADVRPKFMQFNTGDQNGPGKTQRERGYLVKDLEEAIARFAFPASAAAAA